MDECLEFYSVNYGILSSFTELMENSISMNQNLKDFTEVRITLLKLILKHKKFEKDEERIQYTKRILSQMVSKENRTYDELKSYKYYAKMFMIELDKDDINQFKEEIILKG